MMLRRMERLFQQCVPFVGPGLAIVVNPYSDGTGDPFGHWLFFGEGKGHLDDATLYYHYSLFNQPFGQFNYMGSDTS